MSVIYVIMRAGRSLVGRSPTSAGNGRSVCKPIPSFVLAGYVTPLNLGRSNVSIKYVLMQQLAHELARMRAARLHTLAKC